MPERVNAFELVRVLVTRVGITSQRVGADIDVVVRHEEAHFGDDGGLCTGPVFIGVSGRYAASELPLIDTRYAAIGGHF